MDRLRALRVRNFRSLANVTITPGDFKVLIGENGGGKSSICECFEILRRVADQTEFQSQLERIHGGTRGILRWGETQATLTAEIVLEGVPGHFEYSIGFGGQLDRPISLQTEMLVHESGPSNTIFRRTGETYAAVPIERLNVRVPASEAVLRFGDGDPQIRRIKSVIEGIEVQLGFETQALWRTRERPAANGYVLGSLREPTQLNPASRLEHGGNNLVSVLQELKNSPQWAKVKSLVQLGMGTDVEDIDIRALRSNSVEASVRFSDGRLLGLSGLSDGQLGWLCLVAMVMAPGPRSVLIVDEPELHFHPQIAVRALDLLLMASERTPVIIATHSDRILDALDEPATAVEVVQLEAGSTVLRPMSKEFLDAWRPRSLSELRASRGDDGLLGQ